MILAGLTTALAGAGLAQALVGSRLVAAFARRSRAAWLQPGIRPAVTVLKPLHGDEPLLEEALSTVCRQDYPEFQIVFGVQDITDRAVAVVHRLQKRFPDVDIVLVADPGLHGENRKVGNLINMLPAARHDILVIADSDVHVRPDYLDRLVAALQVQGVGLVTTLYAGLPVVSPVPGLGQTRSDPIVSGRIASDPIASCHTASDPIASCHTASDPIESWPGLARPPTTCGAEPGKVLDSPAKPGHDPTTNASARTNRGATLAYPTSLTRPASIGLPARLGATQITHGFLPGALLSRALGRQDCLGATMCLRRDDLQRLGGFHSLVDHLADDNVLGRRIIGLGLRVALAGTIVLTTVPEPDLKALFRHELRWARTIRALEPAGFAASVLQYPLAWALLTVVLTGGALWSIGLFLIAWVLRAVAALAVDSALAPLWTNNEHASAAQRTSNDNAALAFCCPVWLLPLRDAFSVAVMLTSYGGRRVDWRGQSLQAGAPPPITMTRPPTEGNHAR